MQVLVVPPELRQKLGADASKDLIEMFGVYHHFATDRFERRLIEEVSGLRVEFAGFRADMERMRSDLIKWNLLFWIGQFTAMVAVMSYMLGDR